MNNLQLGAAILLIIVAVPLIVGYCWPTDSEVENTWETENELDITPSIATRDIPIIDTYSGPNNNIWLYYLNGRPLFNPVGTTDSPSNIPYTDVIPTTETLTASKSFNPADFTGYRLDITLSTGYISVLENGIPVDHTFSSVSYYPENATIWGLEFGKMTHVTVTQDTRIAYGAGASSANPVTAFYTEFVPIPGRYVDLGQGFRISNMQNYYWSNGLINHNATIWFKTSEIGIITIGPWDAGPVTTIKIESDKIWCDLELIGSPAAYPYVELEITPKGFIIRGVMDADTFTDNSYVYGNSVEVSHTIDPFETMQIAVTGTTIYEIKRTTSEIGTGKGIQDAEIVPYDYYPHYSWQVSLTQPAQYGTEIALPDGYHRVVDGTILVVGLDGTYQYVPVRDLAILSLLLDGQQHIYINGIEIWTGAPDPTITITLRGAWYVNVSVYDVEQGVKDHYLWNVGGFGLDKTGYCMVGIMTSLAMALAGGMYGKRSAGKAAIVLIVSGLSAAAYYSFI